MYPKLQMKPLKIKTNFQKFFQRSRIARRSRRGEKGATRVDPQRRHQNHILIGRCQKTVDRQETGTIFDWRQKCARQQCIKGRGIFQGGWQPKTINFRRFRIFQ
jgi:hypothetical protein